ncbi:MAG: hypothetical protein WC466_08085 [Candidatus Izemoplasmatales bacterium]
MQKEIIYKGKTITKLFPSGFYEFYSEEEKRFLKFDNLINAKKQIDKEMKKEGVSRAKKLTLNELRSLVKKIIKEENEKQENHGEIKNILHAYLEAALWTEEDEIGHANIHTDIDKKSILDAERDIENFVSKIKGLGIYPDMDSDQIGHDLWLTRNGHGAGFWDRKLGEVGEKLSEISREMGGKYVYRGDDGKIHIE